MPAGVEIRGTGPARPAARRRRPGRAAACSWPRGPGFL